MLARAKFIEARANEVLLKTGQIGPPTDLDRIGTHFGIAVIRGSRDSGVLAHFDADRNEIVLGEFDRWPYAHELGHALLGHGTMSCWAGASATDMPLEEAEVGVPFETEANRFARHLLVPKEWLASAVDRGGKVPDLAQLFAVSQKVMWFAMDGYKLI
jgi:hypothetical protein